MLWRRRPLVSPDLGHWIFDSFDWAKQDLGTDWPEIKLVLPTREFFTAGGGKSPETARVVADDIARHLRLSRPFDLMPLDRLDPQYTHEFGMMGDVAGLFIDDENRPLIQYDPYLMDKPNGFISTLAHELIHLKLAGRIDDLPGGEAAHELSTDLHCITHGFGVFQLDAADVLGWAGYMTQPSRAFALAVFLSSRAQGIEATKSHLSGRVLKLLRRAFQELESAPWSDRLQQFTR